MLQRTHDLIRHREIQGIKFALYGKLLVFLTVSLAMIFTGHNPVETIIMLCVFIPSSALMVYFILLIKKNRAVNIVGAVSVIIDIIIIFILPFLWYFTLEDGTVSRAFLLKTILPSIIFLLLIVNSLAINPVYPLMFSLGSTFLYAVLFVVAVQDPRIEYTGDYMLHFMGPQVNVLMYAMNAGGTLFMGLILMTISKRARETIISSAENEVANSQLSRYFSPNVVSSITGSEEDFFKPGGTVQQVVVLFSDIRSFTTISESLSPEDTLSLLADYHRFMVAAIFEFNGTLDKFIGDGLMATFGTPEPSPGDVNNAVKAALRMRESLDLFNTEREKKGLFTIRHGVGIHYGPAIVGNIGIEDRLEYTVIGDTVNIASRIEQQCKEYNADILVSKEILDSASVQCDTKRVGDILLKGKSVSIDIHSLL
ncbi:MAG: adenylate/guanylate cyclase domain-containing protein [bacterium]|nr:adenylate/guanylate cyclase domain-containing protein [bacterium]